jgi:hypothetical protein
MLSSARLSRGNGYSAVPAAIGSPAERPQWHQGAGRGLCWFIGLQRGELLTLVLSADIGEGCCLSSSATVLSSSLTVLSDKEQSRSAIDQPKLLSGPHPTLPAISTFLFVHRSSLAQMRRSTLAASTRGASCPCQASESKVSTYSSEIRSPAQTASSIPRASFRVVSSAALNVSAEVSNFATLPLSEMRRQSLATGRGSKMPIAPLTASHRRSGTCSPKCARSVKIRAFATF